MSVKANPDRKKKYEYFTYGMDNPTQSSDYRTFISIVYHSEIVKYEVLEKNKRLNYSTRAMFLKIIFTCVMIVCLFSSFCLLFLN